MRYPQTHLHEEVYDSLFSCPPLPMVLVDAKHLKIINANNAALEFYGVSSGEADQIIIDPLSASPLSRLKAKIEQALIKQHARRKRTIKFSTSAANDCVAIKFKDSGTGIHENHENNMFAPFFTTKPVGKWTGQGLPMADSVITEKYNGEITFKNNEDYGVTFTIGLPLESNNSLVEE